MVAQLLGAACQARPVGSQQLRPVLQCARYRAAPSIFGRRRQPAVCSTGGGAEAEGHQPPANSASLIQALSSLSKAEGKSVDMNGRKLVLGDTAQSDESWKLLDAQVNTYPSERHIKAIGAGGQSFLVSMVAAVESVTGVELPKDKVAHRLSKQGNYITVNIFVTVENAQQVVDIYEAMKSDSRMKFFL